MEISNSKENIIINTDLEQFFEKAFSSIDSNSELGKASLKRSGNKISADYFFSTEFLRDHRNISVLKSIQGFVLLETQPNLAFLHDRYGEDEVRDSVIMMAEVMYTYFKYEGIHDDETITRVMIKIYEAFHLKDEFQISSSIKNKLKQIFEDSGKE